MSYENKIKELLKDTGVVINGPNDYDIQVHNKEFYRRALAQGSLGLGESYMDGWWDCKRIDKFIQKVLVAQLDKKINLSTILITAKALITNKQKSRSHHIGDWHYNIGNELYKKMLDKNMQYSCGYWKNAKSLDKAQLNKLDLICKKLKLKKGMTLLDIGCGWGTLAHYAAKKYGVKVVGVTVSTEQAKLAQELNKGLPVEIRVQDYRKVTEQFDRIVSVGMIEHVGFKNYNEYMKVANRCLKENGIFLLHTIGANKSGVSTDPWTDKYIFPDGMLPSIKQLAKVIEGKFIIEDMHNFGPYYDKTLMAWYANFKKAWPTLKNKYDERFKRMWTYYLLSCAGAFRARNIQLWQIVLTKERKEVYTRP